LFGSKWIKACAASLWTHVWLRSRGLRPDRDGGCQAANSPH